MKRQVDTRREEIKKVNSGKGKEVSLNLRSEEGRYYLENNSKKNWRDPEIDSEPRTAEQEKKKIKVNIEDKRKENKNKKQI